MTPDTNRSTDPRTFFPLSVSTSLSLSRAQKEADYACPDPLPVQPPPSGRLIHPPSSDRGSHDVPGTVVSILVRERNHVAQEAFAETFPHWPAHVRLGREMGRVENRKALQLCSQIAETLALVLAGESGDDLLRDLLVESVVPYPTSARLLVTLIPAISAGSAPLEKYIEHLEPAKGQLRGEALDLRHQPPQGPRPGLPGAARH